MYRQWIILLFLSFLGLVSCDRWQPIVTTAEGDRAAHPIARAPKAPKHELPQPDQASQKRKKRPLKSTQKANAKSGNVVAIDEAHVKTGVKAHVSSRKNHVRAEPQVKANGGEGVEACVDINTATQVELESLPKVGPVTAKRIIAYRQRRPFKRVRDLRRVKGIGRKTLKRLEGRICKI